MKKGKVIVIVVLLLSVILACGSGGEEDTSGSDGEIERNREQLTTTIADDSVTMTFDVSEYGLDNGTFARLYHDSDNVIISQFMTTPLEVNCSDLKASTRVENGKLVFTFPRRSEVRERYWIAYWYTEPETCEQEPDGYIQPDPRNDFFRRDCAGNDGWEVLYSDQRASPVPTEDPCWEDYLSSLTGHVNFWVNNGLITLSVNMTGYVENGTQVVLHSAILAQDYWAEDCGALAITTVDNGWAVFSFENPAIFYDEDNIRERHWISICYKYFPSCHDVDRWYGFSDDPRVNIYYFEDCGGSSGIEVIYFRNFVATVPWDSECGVAYDPLLLE